MPYLHTACLYDEETKALWIGTAGSGLYRLENGIITAYGTEAGIPHLTINCLYKDRMKNLWIGTDGGGLTRMKDGEFSTLPGGDGLDCGYVYSIYEDREGSLWVGTLDGGLHQLRDNKFTTYTTREGLNHDYVDCIHEDRAGDLWIGTKAGLNRLRQGRVTPFPAADKNLINNSILAIYEDLSGYLWIGTWGAGLYRLKKGKPTNLTEENGLSDNRIRCIAGDRQGNTWIGTDNGLNRFNPSSGTFTVFTTEQGLLSNFIKFIFEDSRGTLWIGTKAGLHHLKDGVVVPYNPGIHLEHNYFRCAYEDSEGTLWFGTGSGLMRLKGKKAFLYTVACGLIENDIYSILEDRGNYLWLAGPNGVSRIKKKELTEFSRDGIDRVKPLSFNEKDGMKSRWCTGSGCKTADHRFWFPTSMGVTVIDPAHIKENNLPPSPIIEKFIVDGETKNIHAGAAAKNLLELGAGTKRLDIYYTGVSFINPRKIGFKLKLAGYDSGWIDMGNLRVTTYTGLPPGHYTFKVTACSPDGVWNEKGVSFSFYIKPYFYQTTWFFIAAALVVILSVFSGYRFRIRQLKTREKELSTLVELRTRDLEKRNIQLGRAHQELRQSKEIIEEKNRNIMDSIHYARRIQQAMLPVRKKWQRS